jgi:hypothetical protein
MAEMSLHDVINKWWLAEKLYLGKVSMIEHNFVKIQEKLSWLSTALANVVSSVPKKEGRRNMVIRWQEESQKSLKKLKRIKSSYFTIRTKSREIIYFRFNTPKSYPESGSRKHFQERHF